MAIEVINQEMDAIIQRALRRVDVPVEFVQAWPGTTFELNGDEEGLALLGIHPPPSPSWDLGSKS